MFTKRSYTHQARLLDANATPYADPSSLSFSRKHFILGVHAINSLPLVHGPYPLRITRFPTVEAEISDVSLSRAARISFTLHLLASINAREHSGCRAVVDNT